MWPVVSTGNLPVCPIGLYQHLVPIFLHDDSRIARFQEHHGIGRVFDHGRKSPHPTKRLACFRLVPADHSVRARAAQTRRNLKIRREPVERVFENAPLVRFQIGRILQLSSDTEETCIRARIFVLSADDESEVHDCIVISYGRE